MLTQDENSIKVYTQLEEHFKLCIEKMIKCMKSLNDIMLIASMLETLFTIFRTRDARLPIACPCRR